MVTLTLEPFVNWSRGFSGVNTITNTSSSPTTLSLVIGIVTVRLLSDGVNTNPRVYVPMSPESVREE